MPFTTKFHMIGDSTSPCPDPCVGLIVLEIPFIVVVMFLLRDKWSYQLIRHCGMPISFIATVTSQNWRLSNAPAQSSDTTSVFCLFFLSFLLCSSPAIGLCHMIYLVCKHVDSAGVCLADVAVDTIVSAVLQFWGWNYLKWLVWMFWGQFHRFCPFWL